MSLLVRRLFVYVCAYLWICKAAEESANADVQIISPSDKRLHWFGRKVLTASVAYFDWIGVGFSLSLASDSMPSAVRAEIDGRGERFAVYVGQTLETQSLVNNFVAYSRAIYHLAEAKPGDVVTLVKATESQIVELHSIQVSVNAFVSWSPLPSRRIEFWGDSDTAAFGVDSKDNSFWSKLGCGLDPNKYENFDHGWVQKVLHALGAEGQVQAISGIGVVKNGGGGTLTLPKLLARRLHSVAKDDYNASTWQPHLVVVYVGSNDYINQVTPSANEFKEAYSAMVKRILDTHGSKVAVLHLCGNIKDTQATRTPCDYIKDVAAAAGQNYSSTMDTETPAACVGHRTARQQAALASRVAPIIAKAVGWDLYQPKQPRLVV